jgi:hypothetical protein
VYKRCGEYLFNIESVVVAHPTQPHEGSLNTHDAEVCACCRTNTPLISSIDGGRTRRRLKCSNVAQHFEPAFDCNPWRAARLHQSQCSRRLPPLRLLGYLITGGIIGHSFVRICCNTQKARVGDINTCFPDRIQLGANQDSLHLSHQSKVIDTSAHVFTEISYIWKGITNFQESPIPLIRSGFNNPDDI